MSLTAIIPHYWNSRTASLTQIVEALRDGECCPDKIIIWNNMPGMLDVPGAAVINAGDNWGITARFAAAYLARTHYVFFQDNDLVVQRDTLKNMLEAVPNDGESIELQGRVLGAVGAARYSTSEYATNVNRMVEVGLSRLSLMTRDTAMRLCAQIPPHVIDDDLWTSRHVRVRLISYTASQGFINLPEQEGLSLDACGHVSRRDRLVQQLWG